MRCLLSLRPRLDLRGFVFADDMGLAVRRVVDVLRLRFPFFLLVLRAAGIGLHGGPSGADEVRAAHRHAGAVQVPDSARMQGSIFGPVSADRRWEAPTRKFAARARHVKALGLAYRMLATGVLRYLGQFAEPDRLLLRAEQSAIAAVMCAPMHSMGGGITKHLQAAGARTELSSIALDARAAQICSVIQNAEIQQFIEEIDAAAASEDAALVPRYSVWQGRNLVAAVRMVYSHYIALPQQARASVSYSSGLALHLRAELAELASGRRGIGCCLKSAARGTAARSRPVVHRLRVPPGLHRVTIAPCLVQRLARDAAIR